MKLFSHSAPELWAKQLPTRWAGKGLMDYHEALPSTNARLKELARQDAPHGSLCLCRTQTAGRGRLQRSWISAPGEALTFSLLLKPELSPETLPLCTFAAALAVCSAIQRLCPSMTPKIKWPNDIVIEGKKCTGILSELVTDSSGDACVVMGVGINVAQSVFPDEIAHSATSLLKVLRITDPLKDAPNLETLLALFLEEMEACMEMLSADTPAFLAACKAQSATLGQRVQVLGREECFIGMAEDMDESGALLVRDSENVLRRVLSGDVSVRGLMGYI